MRTTHVLPALAVAVTTLFLAPVSSHANQPTVTREDRTFVLSASSSNMAEIAAANVALVKGNAGVKTFARKMISDHSKMEKSLSAIATKLGVGIEATPTPVQKSALAKISALSGSAFDRAYRSNQIVAHQTTISDFQAELAHGGAVGLKAAARSNLPVIRMHLAMAKRLPVGATSS